MQRSNLVLATLFLSIVSALPLWANDCVASGSGPMSQISWASCGGTYPQNGDTLNANNSYVTVDQNRTFGGGGNATYGPIRSITVTNGGSGYSSGAATFSNLSYPSGGMPVATATCNVSGGSVQSISINNRGVSVVTGAVGVTCPGGSGMAATVDIDAGGVAAINAGSGSVTIAPNVSVVARGDVLRNITMLRGSSLIVDTSASPANTFYWYGAGGNFQDSTIDATDCTQAQPCTFGGNSPGQAVESGQAGFAGGSGAIQGNWLTVQNVNGLNFVQDWVMWGMRNCSHCTFKGTGQIGWYVGSSDFVQQYNTYLSVNTNQVSGIVFPSGACAEKGASQRIFSHNVVATGKAFNVDGGSQISLCETNMDGNLFEDATNGVSYGSGSTFTDNVYTWDGLSQPISSDNMLRGFVWTAGYNQHAIRAVGTSPIFSGVICDDAYRMMSGDDTGNCLLNVEAGNPSNLLWTVTQSVQSLDISGAPASELTTLFPSFGSGNAFTITHNLELGSALYEDGACHNGLDSQIIASMQGNLLWGVSINNYRLYKTHNIDGCSCSYTVDVPGAAIGNNYSYGNVDASIWPGVQNGSSCTTYTNGYYGKFAVTPGTSDVSGVNPYFTDLSRTVALMPTRYFGIAVGTDLTQYWGTSVTAGQWASGTFYPYGSAVISSDPTTYRGLPVLYRCSSASGCPANYKPSVSHQMNAKAQNISGLDTVSNWEFGMKQIFRNQIVAGSRYVDGALSLSTFSGCAAAPGCTITQLAWAWYMMGVMPQQPALRTAAYDGGTVGPVQMRSPATVGAVVPAVF